MLDTTVAVTRGDDLEPLLHGLKSIRDRVPCEQGRGLWRELNDIISHIHALSSPKGSWNKPGDGYQELSIDHKSLFREHVLTGIVEYIATRSGSVSKDEINIAINKVIDTFCQEEDSGNRSQYISIANNMRVILNGIFRGYRSYTSIAAVAVKLSLPPEESQEIIESRNLSMNGADLAIGAQRFQEWLERQKDHGDPSQFKPTYSSKKLFNQRLSDAGQADLIEEINILITLLESSEPDDIYALHNEIYLLNDKLRKIACPAALPTWYQEREKSSPRSLDEEAVHYNISKQGVIDSFHNWIANGGSYCSESKESTDIKNLISDKLIGTRFYGAVLEFSVHYGRGHLNDEERDYVKRTCNDYLAKVRNFINKRLPFKISQTAIVPYVVLISRANTLPDFDTAEEIRAVADRLNLPNEDILLAVINEFAPKANEAPNGINQADAAKYALLQTRDPLVDIRRRSFLSIFQAEPNIAEGPILAYGTSYDLLSLMLPSGVKLVGSNTPPTVTLGQFREEAAQNNFRLVVFDAGMKSFTHTMSTALLSVKREQEGVAATVFIGHPSIPSFDLDPLKKSFGLGLTNTQLRFRSIVSASVYNLMREMCYLYKTPFKDGELERARKKVYHYLTMQSQERPNIVGKPGTMEMCSSVIPYLYKLVQSANKSGALIGERYTKATSILDSANSIMSEFGRLRRGYQQREVDVSEYTLGGIVQECSTQRIPYYDLLGRTSRLWTGSTVSEYSYPELETMYKHAQEMLAGRIETGIRNSPIITEFLSDARDFATSIDSLDDSERNSFLDRWGLHSYLKHVSLHGIQSLTHWVSDSLNATDQEDEVILNDRCGVFLCLTYSRSLDTIEGSDKLRSVVDILHQINLLALKYGGPTSQVSTVYKLGVDVSCDQENLNLTMNYEKCKNKRFIIPLRDLADALSCIERLKRYWGLRCLEEHRKGPFTLAN